MRSGDCVAFFCRHTIICSMQHMDMQAQENSRHDAMKNAMLQAIRALIQFDGKELSQLFLKPATGFEGYTDVIKNPICLLDIM